MHTRSLHPRDHGSRSGGEQVHSKLVVVVVVVQRKGVGEGVRRAMDLCWDKFVGCVEISLERAGFKYQVFAFALTTDSTSKRHLC